MRHSIKCSLPLIVIGNISVGGNGKTPVLIAIAKHLTRHGLKVAVVSRGYQAKATTFPCWCDGKSDPRYCGDEPVMIAAKTNLPVVIDPIRSRGVKAIEATRKFDVILSDDGLQHYKMQRTFEIAVVGSTLALGNQWLLPAGPLREPLTRLKTVNWVLGDERLPYVQYGIKVMPEGVYELTSGKRVEMSVFKNKKIHAITGIALPERFHQSLKEMGLNFSSRSFADHHHFKVSDFTPYLEDLIVMTEKDAVKCRNMSLDNAYVVKIDLHIAPQFLAELLTAIQHS